VNAHNAIGRGRFREGSAFRPWLLKIVVNQSLNMLKSRKRRTVVAERAATESAPHEYAIDETLIDRERARLIYKALDRLKEQERVVVYLRYFLALPERELAEYLGVPPGTVKSRLHRALAKLREIVARDYPGLMLEMNQ
jgi:RNA polymerase sigma-70 factor, ECF subfamily